MASLQIPSRLFAAIYDRMNAPVEEAGGREIRRELLAASEGATLEIGAGTGANLEHYPAAVTRLVLLEPEAAMAAKLSARLDGLGRSAEIVAAGADPLPFDDDAFDTVVVTLVLCTVPDQVAALAGIDRVLKPGGRLLFIEHVRSEDERIARRQDRLRPVWNVIGRGCNPNRDTLAALQRSPLEVETVRREWMDKAPSFTREAIVGVARTASGAPA
jgi:ubiquinone/menaquinone biosynthesis C-methylase UbiE